MKTCNKEKLFDKIPGIGDLFSRYIYYFYDEPLMFSCVNNTGNYYLCMRYITDEPVWILSEISAERLKGLEMNIVPVRDVFVNPETSYLFKVAENKNQYTIEIIDPHSLSDNELPYDGAMLDLSHNELNALYGKDLEANEKPSFISNTFVAANVRVSLD